MRLQGQPISMPSPYAPTFVDWCEPRKQDELVQHAFDGNGAFPLVPTVDIWSRQIPEECSESSVESSSGKTQSNRNRRIACHRWRPNAKERARVTVMRTAFERLSEHLPKDPAERLLTRSQTIRRASSYIRYLRNLLDEPSDSDGLQAMLPTSSSESTASTSDDERRSVDSSDCFFLPSTAAEETSGLFSARVTRRVQAHRVAINATTRRRSRKMRQGFEQLRTCVPVHPSEPQLDKIRLVKRATEYIGTLMEMLSTSQANSRSPFLSSCVETASQATSTASSVGSATPMSTGLCGSSIDQLFEDLFEI